VISDRARTLEKEKEMKVGGAARGEATERQRERVGRGIEERNQRRLSAYEVGIVGSASVRSLSKNRSPLGPVVAGSARVFDAGADVFSKWRRISR